MAITSKKSQKHHIDIDGPAGNAFVLLGYAQNYAKQLGLDVEKIQEELKSSDYNNLLLTFDKYFGEFVVLETTNESILSFFNSQKS